MKVNKINKKHCFSNIKSKVYEVFVDYRFIINIKNGVSVCFECPFALCEEERTRRIDPTDKYAVGDALCVLHEPVDQIHVASTGDIDVIFSNGIRMESGAHPRYESWSLNTKSGLYLVCLPGGGLAEWWPDHIVPTERAS